MRDFKSILLLSLFFVGSITQLSASELLHVCRIKPPPLTFASNCNPYGGATYFGGEGCEREILLKIYLSNLSGYDNLPIPNMSYSTPAYLPDMYVGFDSDFNNTIDTYIGPINDFKWGGIEQNGMDGGTHYVFEHDINLADYLQIGDPCPGPVPNQNLSIELVQMDEAGGYSLYEIEPFSNFDDVISCEVFHEACKYCFDENGNPINSNCGNNQPVYNVPLCFDCTTPCETQLTFKAEDGNEEIEMTKNQSITTSKVSPNPFQDEVLVEFDVQEEAPVMIEIIDLSGSVIFNKKLSTEVGSKKERIDLDGLPKGIYILKLTSNNTSKATKIVKL